MKKNSAIISEIDRARLKLSIEHYIKYFIGKRTCEITKDEALKAISLAVREFAMDKMYETIARYNKCNSKRIFYLSIEYLIGRSLENNLHNLRLFDILKEVKIDGFPDISMAEIFDTEYDPALGNGGLGRLAACYLDSMASLGIPGFGYGINYEYGLFKQKFENGYQIELADNWEGEDSPWQFARPDRTVKIPIFGEVETLDSGNGQKNFIWMNTKNIYGVPFDFPIVGYEGKSVNYLRLFSAKTDNELDINIFNEGGYIEAVKNSIETETISKVLYPSDAVDSGKELRFIQQYFFVSCAIQDIVRRFLEKSNDFSHLPDKVCIQLNDTHPAIAIAELMRLLVDIHGQEWDTAWDITTRVFAYTNHTLLPEALETWPRSYLDKVVPQLMPVIEKLDAAAKKRTNDTGLAIIDADDRVHMAHMDIHFTHSTNGVAALHTKILKESELNGFYKLYPEKFNNKTNGITFRRWLLECDPALVKEIESLIGPGFRKDAAELEKLLPYAEDANVLQKFSQVKADNKKALADWLEHTQGVKVDPTAMFDIQSKRLHEYKRQQLNLLYLIHQYFEIRAGHTPAVPLVSIFGAKAAPAYIIAKDIIHALLTLSKVIAADPLVAPWLQVVFVENYNVTAAEKMIPACDLSEQISLASKEASGTGNMKFMLNGALTLGTMDGANVEICQQVGNENIYIFGQTSGQVIHRYAAGDYNPADWYEGDPNLRRAIDFLTGPEMLAAGKEENLARLQHELKTKDWFQTLPDFNAYVVRKGQALSDYACDPLGWRRKCLINISKAGFFSSDRTIAEYNSDIWHLGE